MRPITTLIAILAATMAFSTPALGDDAKRKDDSATSGASSSSAKKPEGGVSRDLEKEFKALDRNGDGFVSKDEMQSDAMKDKFSTADKNSDGKLDMAEFQSLEAEASPDRSLGAVPPTGQGSGTHRLREG